MLTNIYQDTIDGVAVAVAGERTAAERGCRCGHNRTQRLIGAIHPHFLPNRLPETANSLFSRSRRLVITPIGDSKPPIRRAGGGFDRVKRSCAVMQRGPPQNSPP